MLIALLAINLSGYWGADAIPDVTFGLYNALSAGTQVQQHFFLGPVNDVVHGRALLVDANSVYGISSTYLSPSGSSSCRSTTARSGCSAG